MSNISTITQLKTACVTKKGNRYYYPKTIPREREPLAYTYIVLQLVVLIIHLCVTEDRSSIISIYAFSTCFYFFVILAHRIVLLIGERPHSLSRYGNDYIKMLKSAFTFTGTSIVVFVLCILYIVFYLERYGCPNFKMEFWFVMVFLFILHRIFDLLTQIIWLLSYFYWPIKLECRKKGKEADFFVPGGFLFISAYWVPDFSFLMLYSYDKESNPINDSLNIAEGNGLDYGSGMAYSFFYGYLNYILPKTGDQEKNLKELMQDYEAVNDIRFEIYKIFILIPKSLECPVSIEEASNGLIEMRESLLEKTITVAGVKDRVYKNSVYSIKHEKTNRKVYVCTEYATPIKTFKEVVKNVTPHTEYYNRHKNDILLQFYVTLRQILEHTHMDKMCELVFYEDMDANNKYHDVGLILLDRIVEIKKRE